LRNGVIVVVSAADGDWLHLYDRDGELETRVPLPAPAIAAPARTGPWVAVACEGLRLVLFDLRHSDFVVAAIRLTAATLDGPLLGVDGNFVARIRPADGGALFLRAAAARFQSPGLAEDPFPEATGTRWGTSHDLVFCGATDPTGHAVGAAWDLIAGRFAWTAPLGPSPLIALRASGGRLDILLDDRVVTAFGYDLSGRRDALTGLGFASAAFAGEHVLVRLGAAHERLGTFHLSTEESGGEIDGVTALIGADTNHALVQLGHDGPTFVELPELVPMPLRDADALSEPSRVAFAWDRIWVVHDDATAMTSIDRPRSD
jgi:hypothetical protein